MKLNTRIMGILNLTPDSFYDGNRYFYIDAALKQAVKMYRDGANIIDIGGESTRPGSDPVSIDEEMDRVLEPLVRIKKEIPVPVSIDTYKSEIAEEACKAGAEIVNDISGITFDPKMFDVLIKYDVKVVIMHIKGTPKNMQANPYYDNVISEIKSFLAERIEYAEKKGIKPEKIIVDPGIGFGKRLEDNLKIIKYLDKFKPLGKQVLIGVSRKSFIGKILDVEPEERLEGSLAASIMAVVNGANIVRVHDVKETVRALKVAESIIYS